MAGEFQHKAVGTELTQAEYEGAARHELNGQAQGDVLYVNATPDIVRLAVDEKGAVLGSRGAAANPVWVPSGRVNLLVNPGFEIWQRGTSFGDPNAYTADRWYGAKHPSGSPESSGLTVSRDTDDDDYSHYSCKVVHDGTAGTDSPNMLVQEVENGQEDLCTGHLVIGEYDNHPITFAADVRVLATGVVRLVIETENGGVWTEVAGTTIAEGSGRFKRFHVTAQPIPYSKTGVRVGFKFLSGLTCTAWLDNCTLSRGWEPMSYNPLSKAEEWARCLRYYEILGDKAAITIKFEGYADAARSMTHTMSFFPKAVVPTVTKEGTWTVINCGQPIVSATTVSQLIIHAVSSGTGWTEFTADSVGERITIEANP